MPTYTIVANNTDPLGPNEIRAGGTIQVNDGDVFIVDPTANRNTKFEAASNTSTDFEVRFEQSNTNKLDIEFKDNLNPTVNISDDVDLSRTFIKADKTESITVNAGDRVSLKRYDGSKDGVDTFTAGDDFSMKDALKTDGGNDVIRIGANADLKEIDGGKDFNVLYTQTDPADLKIKNIDEINIVCFAAGTLITTATGLIAIEDLKAGDMVTTLDHGEQPIRWIGSRTLGLAELTAKPKLKPIRFSASALGGGLPTRDLVVSPQHRVLIRSAIAERMFGVTEVLMPANKLVRIDGINIVEDTTEITYFHMLFDQHEIVFSEGAATESLYPGPQALAGLEPEAIEEIDYLFPELTDQAFVRGSARLIPTTGKQMKTLAYRHSKNHKALFDELL
ncbi:Hint domain-containing protein [Roseovarius sp. Pro17]|uniref:Hint domain-containing protein n=1 Tax=Roseovarius sp. Pro17 TaxID=3108175 RepID=UPI002D7A2D49|nr:Hint domain-containing protein [Roseovarius sp. Pro17]